MQIASKKVAVKATKKATLKTSIVKAKNGMALEVQGNVKGADIVKAKRELSELQVSKISSNKVHKNYIGGFRFILDSFKERANTYLKHLNEKNDTKVSMEQILALKPVDLCKLMTAKESERQAKNGNLWSFWQVENLVARYLKATK